MARAAALVPRSAARALKVSLWRRLAPRFSALKRGLPLRNPERATLSGGLTGPLGASQGTGHVTLSEENGGTRVTYDYAIALSGTVASVGGRMLEGAARALVNQFFNRLVAQVGGGQQTGGAAASAPAAESWWTRLLRSLGIAK